MNELHLVRQNMKILYGDLWEQTFKEKERTNKQQKRKGEEKGEERQKAKQHDYFDRIGL